MKIKLKAHNCCKMNCKVILIAEYIGFKLPSRVSPFT